MSPSSPVQRPEQSRRDDKAPRPAVRLVGSNRIPLWGLPPAARVSRIAAAANLEMIDTSQPGPVLLISSDYAFDPLWLNFMRNKPGTVLTIDGQPAMAHLPINDDSVADALRDSHLPAGLQIIRAEDHRNLYNSELRKHEWPFLIRLTPQAVPDIERRSYYAAYKGVTDLLTKYLWPEWALALTRIAARVGLTPNMVTAIGVLFNILAMLAFWQGDYWPGMAAALVFMVLDTVDGKLARCTITSSWWGNIFDHGIDLIHPPFWWWAWGVGLGAWGLSLPDDSFALVMIAIIGGYVVQRMIEGTFIQRYGMHIHVWEKADSDFRLITARRNPNMVILFVSLLLGRPDLGLIAVAWWTVLSCLFHAVRLFQAEARRRRGEAITSWLVGEPR